MCKCFRLQVYMFQVYHSFSSLWRGETLSTICFGSCLCFGHAYIPILLCSIECMLGWSFTLLYDRCSHFYMIVLVFDQVMFHNMFTWSLFTCYIILVLLLFALPWGSNVFCASISGYRYICSKCITASHHFEGEKF